MSQRHTPATDALLSRLGYESIDAFDAANREAAKAETVEGRLTAALMQEVAGIYFAEPRLRDAMDELQKATERQISAHDSSHRVDTGWLTHAAQRAATVQAEIEARVDKVTVLAYALRGQAI